MGFPTRPHPLLRRMWQTNVVLLFSCPPRKTHKTNLLPFFYDPALGKLVIVNIAACCLLLSKVFLAKADKDKVRANSASCARIYWECRGLAFSPWGGSGPAATALVRNLLDRATVDETGWPKQRARQELARQLAFALSRRVAKQLDMRRRVGDLLA